MSESSRPAGGDSTRTRKTGNFGAAVLTVAVLAVFLYFIRLILIPFVLAGALAFILSLLADFITRRTGLPRPAAASALFFALLAILGAFAFFTYPSLAREAPHFLGDLKGALTKAFNGIAKGGEIHILGNTYNAAQLADQTQAILREWLGQPANLVTVAGAGFGAIFSVFLSVVLLFYFLLSGRQIVSSLIALAPPRHRPLITKVITKVSPVLQRYFAGVSIVVIYAATAAYIGLGLILGLRHAVLLAIATGLLEMLPVAGPFLSGVLAGLVALQGATSVWNVLEYVIYATALRLSIDQLVGPLVLGRAASLSPVTVIFCFLSGEILYGIVGVILAVPVALTVGVTLKTIYGEIEEA